MKIEELNFSALTHNCLKRAGIETVEELKEMTPEEIKRIRNLGKRSLDEISMKLKQL